MPFTQRAISRASIFWHSCFCFLLSLIQASAAIDIIFDYSYDSGNYFSDDRKYIMEQVAYVFESRMVGESFAGYRPSEDLGLSSITGLGLNFTSPSSSATLQSAVASTTSDGNVIGKANELIVFLGAKSIAGSTLASAGQTGRTGYSGSGADLTAMQNALNAKNSNTNFEPIAGSSQVNTNKTFYFDTDLTTHTDALSSGKTDFYTVMVHEIGHVMGFQTNNAWNANKSGSFWTGANAKAEYNGENIPLYGTSHWDLPTDGGPVPPGNLNPSKVNCACHPSMLPSIGINSRSSFSDLDFALLKDIGYSISAAPVGANIGGTYTDATWGGTYDIPVSQTYADWLAGGGGGGGSGSAAPEPAEIFPAISFFALAVLAWRRRRRSFGIVKNEAAGA